MKALRALVIVPYFVLAGFPLFWLGLTSFKTYEATISNTAKFLPGGSEDPSGVIFTATLDAYRQLSVPVAGTDHGFYHYLWNSVVVGALSTLAAVCLGTLCAYGFFAFFILRSR